jgi:hypothetical protein
MNNKEKLEKSKEIFFNLCNNKIDIENINFIDSVGATPLIWAIILGNYNLVNFLLQNGADINIRVFPFVYQIIIHEWILISALNIFSLLLPVHMRNIFEVNKIKKILNIFKSNSYFTEKGIPVKYIANICYELTKIDCVIKMMLSQWDTQEKFNYKMRITFWLYPKIASSDNKYMQKFLKDPKILLLIRNKMFTVFNYNCVIYEQINELIPISSTPIEEFFNKTWVDIIVPEFLHNIVANAICNCKD